MGITPYKQTCRHASSLIACLSVRGSASTCALPPRAGFCEGGGGGGWPVWPTMRFFAHSPVRPSGRLSIPWYVCMYACIYVACVHTCMRLCLYLHASAYVCMCLRGWVCVCVLCVCVCGVGGYACMCISMFVYAHANMHAIGPT